jgi:putative ABC transport system permease protein
VHRSAVPGLVLVVVGPILLAFSGGWGAGGNGRKALFQLGGLLAIAVGLLLLAPLCVSVLGPVARRAPVASRLALRDLARYRARSGAALAAISFAVLIAMVVALLATARYADPVDYFGPNLPANEMMVYPPGSGPGAGGPQKVPGQAAPAGPTDPRSVADGIAAALGTHDVLALQSTGAFLGERTTNGVLSYGGTLFVATPDVLRHYGIDPARVDPSALLITARANLPTAPNLQLQVADSGPGSVEACPPADCVANPRIQVLHGLPTGTSEPNLMLTTHAVDSLHLQATAAGWLVRTTGALTDPQINTARQTAAAAGMTIETKNAAPSLDQLRNYATGAGILLALAILAMTIGLIRSETASDLRTLTATGAGRGLRRRITAATAGALGLLGAVLGTAAAYAAATALFRGELSQRMSQPPVLDLLLVLVGLPVAAMVVSWLVAGREPAVIARQPLE